jgi:PhnB protein
MSQNLEPTVIPYVLVDGAARAIDFYSTVFGAEECGARYTDPRGKVGHAELQIGNSKLMLADAQPDAGYTFSPIMMLIHVADVDTAVRRAEEAGALLTRPIKNEAYGHRTGMVKDPFGHSWMITAQIEEVSREELQRRVEGEYTID